MEESRRASADTAAVRTGEELNREALSSYLRDKLDGAANLSIEQFPGGQSRKAVDVLTDYLTTGKKPEKDLILLTPIAITKANLDKAERLNEMK